eukprot:CAMPEP_0173385246 /NCGR_PEP_ID=MMETSP1356-20130122/7857_1 /TAXON_ID=77927 ORGANISM="Hemiselmis virescens, Strain PCC157" /NCGR_SAMPLE_ID=MMETSP1356 /ASSEMBLY_ACC=CAM_ASM_000847 /LENGTH=65 /DNA_ID=CAMNT_0014340961 /DNA_START=305 /DNA_END=502 /DNA_ORIENTATION=-
MQDSDMLSGAVMLDRCSMQDSDMFAPPGSESATMPAPGHAPPGSGSSATRQILLMSHSQPHVEHA